MRYERKKEENSEVFYEVLENSTKAAEFSYQQKFDETGQVCEKFWIRRIYLEQKCLDYRYLDAILQFIQYKCWYYETAKKAGTTAAPDRMSDGEIPEQMAQIRARFREKEERK